MARIKIEVDMEDVFSKISDNDLIDELEDRGYEIADDSTSEDECDCDEVDEEKIGVEYAYEAFREITSFEDFQDKLRDINNLRMNFMKPIGLKL